VRRDAAAADEKKRRKEKQIDDGIVKPQEVSHFPSAERKSAKTFFHRSLRDGLRGFVVVSPRRGSLRSSFV
jgi:hypothetical protein